MKRLLIIAIILCMAKLMALEPPDMDYASLIKTEHREKLPGILEDLHRIIDPNYIWKNFKVEPKVKWCKPKTSLTKIFGIKSHIIEPNIIAEVTRQYMRFEFLQLDIAGYSKLYKMGKLNEHQGAGYLHIFKFPILGQILKKATNGFICFDQGSISVMALSEFDPSSWNSLLRLQVVPTLRLFMNPKASFYGVSSCIAGTTLNQTSSDTRIKETGKTLRAVIDQITYNVGCNGMKSIGAHINTSNPLSSALDIIYGHLDMVSTDTYLLPQTVESIINGYDDDIYCRPSIGIHPMINSQFEAQLLRPRVGKPFISSTTPAEWAAFRNDGTTLGNSVFFLWSRRDFSMGAYACEQGKE